MLNFLQKLETSEFIQVKASVHKFLHNEINIYICFNVQVYAL